MATWLAKESLGEVYSSKDPAEAEFLVDKTIVGRLADEVPEIVTLGKTLSKWRREILGY